MKRIYVLTGITAALVAAIMTLPTAVKTAYIQDYVGETISPQYKWTQVAPAGSGTHQHEWKPGTYPSAVVPLLAFNNNLWMVGQKRSWSSRDGIHWQAFDKKDWGERISTAPVFFHNTFWISGGMEYNTKRFLNEIWSSKDGKEWSRVVKNAEWSPRKNHTVVEFKDRLWLFGGETSVDHNLAPKDFINDVWSSSDGMRWTKVMDEAPWKIRGQPRVIEFRKKLWLVGGQGHSDTWTSADGKNWTKVSDQSPWKDRYDYGLMSFDNLLWIYGGRESNTRNAYNDVWLSPDGVHWIQQTDEAPWTRRSGGFSVVFQEKLFLYGGKHTGHDDSFSGDIWTLKRVESTSE